MADARRSHGGHLVDKVWRESRRTQGGQAPGRGQSSLFSKIEPHSKLFGNKYINPFTIISNCFIKFIWGFPLVRKAGPDRNDRTCM